MIFGHQQRMIFKKIPWTFMAPHKNNFTFFFCSKKQYWYILLAFIKTSNNDLSRVLSRQCPQCFNGETQKIVLIMMISSSFHFISSDEYKLGQRLDFFPPYFSLINSVVGTYKNHLGMEILTSTKTYNFGQKLFIFVSLLNVYPPPTTYLELCCL